jgi:hypothetical protein
MRQVAGFRVDLGRFVDWWKMEFDGLRRFDSCCLEFLAFIVLTIQVSGNQSSICQALSQRTYCFYERLAFCYSETSV